MAVRAGEARSFVERFPASRAAQERVEREERQDGDDLVATGACVDEERRARWEIGARVGPAFALVFSFNDDGPEDELLRAAKTVFESIRVAR